MSVSAVWTGSSGTVYVVSGGWTLVSDSDGHENVCILHTKLAIAFSVW